MTCPSLRYPALADLLGERSRAALDTVTDRLRREDTIAQFARFVLVGGTSTVFYASLFLAFSGSGYMPAHLVATVASSVLANELHRRLTFHAGERVSFLTAQAEAGSVSFVGLVATSSSLAWLDSVAGASPAILQIGLVAAVTAVIGVMRFVGLRWIFRPTEVVPAQ